MELENFLPCYYPQSYRRLQEDIATYLEFMQVRSTQIPKKYNNFFNHQELILRFMRQYRHCFIIHETGTGKSGTIINVADNLYGNEVNKVYILQPGQSTRESFKNEILKLSKLDSSHLKYISNEKDRKINTSRLIGKIYNVMGYGEFSNKVKQYTDDEELIEEFSDTLFVLDEVHKNRDDGSNTSVFDDDTIYQSLWKVFHLGKRNKIMVSTATPMINKVNDFVDILNLILEKDNQLPKKLDYRLIHEDQLFEYMKNIFSYVRSLNEDIDVVYMGEKLNHSYKIEFPHEDNDFKILPTKKEIKDGKIVIVEEHKFPKLKSRLLSVESSIYIYPIEMSVYQSQIYHSLKSNNTLYQAHREVSQSVFLKVPNKKKLYGNTGMYTVNGDDVQFNAEYLELMKTGDIWANIRMISCKYHFICENEMKNWGKAFGYSEYLNGSGLYHLGLLLELIGFERYKMGGLRPSDTSEYYNVVGMSKKKRFAILHAGANNDQIMNMFNSPDNLRGEYLQLLLGTNVTKVGINLNNTIRFYMITPLWNEAGMYQAQSRIMRTFAHKWLKEKGIKFDIQIYNLCAIPKSISTVKKEIQSESSKSKIQDSSIKEANALSEGIDLHLYQTSERKDIETRLKLHSMKKFAFDAILNYKRNNLETDKPNSKETDYSERQFIPYILEKKIDFNSEEYLRRYEKFKEWDYDKFYEKIEKDPMTENWRLFYADEQSQKIKNNLLQFFKKHNKATSKDIFKIEAFNRNRYLVSLALHNLKKDKQVVVDELGFWQYVNLEEDVYLSYGIDSLDFDNVFFTEPLQLQVKKEKVDYTKFKDMNKEEIWDELKGKSQSYYYDLLEFSVLNNYKNVINEFSIYVQYLPDLSELVEHAEFKLYREKDSGRGRKTTVGNILRLRSANYEQFDIDAKEIDALDLFSGNSLEKNSKKNTGDNSRVRVGGSRGTTIHCFQRGDDAQKSYSSIDFFYTQKRDIRILKNGEWIDSKLEENHAYNWYLQKYVFDPILNKYPGVWGSYILHDDKFRIHNYVERSKGIDCKTMGVDKLDAVYDNLQVKESKKTIKSEICDDLYKLLEKENKLLRLL